jgi:hypothetical protein
LSSGPSLLLLDTPAGGGGRVRQSTDGVTSASVIAAVDGDARLPTQRDKCRVFRNLAGWGRGFDRKDYPTAGAQGCAQFPFDDYPWPGGRPAAHSDGGVLLRAGSTGLINPTGLPSGSSTTA